MGQGLKSWELNTTSPARINRFSLEACEIKVMTCASCFWSQSM
jgi:hypothetical protein